MKVYLTPKKTLFFRYFSQVLYVLTSMERSATQIKSVLVDLKSPVSH